MPRILHSDHWGEVIHRPEAAFLEVRWFDSTHAMSQDDFNRWLDMFACHVEEHRHAGVLVDATSFSMPMARMDGAYRDAVIVPRYNAAGVKHFAFLVPTNTPSVGKKPTHEGPAEYLTAYFDKRNDALHWLRGRL